MTATKDNITSNTVNVEVTNAIILNVSISNLNIQITEFYGVQLQAYAHYSDGNTENITETATWLAGPNITGSNGLIEPAPFQYDGYVTNISVAYLGMTSQESMVTMRASVRSDVIGSTSAYGIFIAADSHPELRFYAGQIFDAIYDNTTGERLAGDTGGWAVGDPMFLLDVSGRLMVFLCYIR
ncbi:hypothetical protein JCM19233_5585 [Vibrio astriarenae]|nr:hypothetical protein JCM19233_5585 [Vibrio sp. C7]